MIPNAACAVCADNVPASMSRSTTNKGTISIAMAMAWKNSSAMDTYQSRACLPANRKNFR